jgi:uncharacterized Fe-S cluster protein YjdI
MKKEYQKDDLTIVWKSDLCIHSAECIKRLPRVYNPQGRPWIKPENASIEELKTQINACPSGALSYYIKNEEKTDKGNTNARIEVSINGPLLIHGEVLVKGKDGIEIKKGPLSAFCRCGASANKPYCDGSHMRIDFKDE